MRLGISGVAGIGRVKERLLLLCSLDKHGQFFWCARNCRGRRTGQRGGAGEILHTAASVFARRWILLLDSGGVVARPTQTPRTIRFVLPTVATNRNHGQTQIVKSGWMNRGEDSHQAAAASRELSKLWVASFGKRLASSRSTSASNSWRIWSRGVSSNQFRNHRHAAGSPNRQSASKQT